GTSQGTIQVNGTTAVLPIPATDNALLDPLRSLIVRLEPSLDYALAGTTQNSVIIEENDADWQGTLILSNGLSGMVTASLTNRSGGGFKEVTLQQNTNTIVGFTLRIQQTDGNFHGQIHSEGNGFFPTNALVQILVTKDHFSAVAARIPLPPLAESPLFSAPHHLDLRLDAMNVPGQTNVGSTRISGAATWVSVVPGRPYLDSEFSGTFLLLKPPAIPSTRDVSLGLAP
ncbi:MAG TPA: hypothetical protein P5055_07725, partial [Candidatus Paceibacterota bacterium]|nr:hypothetical protein [Candidatus Paceibacterota bacterium]